MTRRMNRLTISSHHHMTGPYSGLLMLVLDHMSSLWPALHCSKGHSQQAETNGLSRGELKMTLSAANCIRFDLKNTVQVLFSVKTISMQSMLNICSHGPLYPVSGETELYFVSASTCVHARTFNDSPDTSPSLHWKGGGWFSSSDDALVKKSLSVCVSVCRCLWSITIRKHTF